MENQNMYHIKYVSLEAHYFKTQVLKTKQKIM
jgi:hypothetical protein